MKDVQEKIYCRVCDLGLVEYERAHEEQKRLVDDVLADGPQTILLCEHPPVITLGRLSDKRHILFPQKYLQERGVPVHFVDRGGDVTLHAPGQLVVYPILRLSEQGKDLHAYMRGLEQVVIDLLAGFDIVANRFPGRTGVWIGRQKIASIGIGVRKWVSYHGLAVNVNTELGLFDLINPCGLDVSMTSVARLKKEQIDMGQVKQEIVGCFKKHFCFDV